MTGDAPAARARRRWLLPAAILALAAFTLFYAWAIEPAWVVATHHTVRAPRGVQLRAPLKIAHLTDLHTPGLGRRERNVLAILAAEKPDLIVITGDSLARGGAYRQSRELLAQLRAPLGVYAVRGNWENWIPPGNEREHYRLAGVHILVNQGAAPREDVWLAGVDDPDSGAPNLPAALSGAPAGALRIGLFHSPGYFDSVAPQLHLAFAGHTHGGQVRIPLLPPLWMPNGAGRFVAGWYDAKPGAAGSEPASHTPRLYVSRGVGTSILPLRFFCRPEVALITVTNSE